MKRIWLCSALLLTVALPSSANDATREGTLVGDYLEARTAEVFVGYCLANSETGLVGQEAVMAWRVRSGSWDGVALDGLSVVAIVEASTTLGDVRVDPVSARSVVVVDEAATPIQQQALLGLVRSMAGSLVDDIVAVDRAPIWLAETETHGLRAVRVGEIAAIEVRERRHEDGLCGNEEAFYPPLVDLEHFHTAFTVRNEYLGDQLSSTWRSPGKSSAFVGTFVR